MNNEYIPEAYGFKPQSDREILLKILEKVERLEGDLRAENSRFRSLLDHIIKAHDLDHGNGRFWGINYADNVKEAIEWVKLNGNIKAEDIYDNRG